MYSLWSVPQLFCYPQLTLKCSHLSDVHSGHTHAEPLHLQSEEQRHKEGSEKNHWDGSYVRARCPGAENMLMNLRLKFSGQKLLFLHLIFEIEFVPTIYFLEFPFSWIKLLHTFKELTLLSSVLLDIQFSLLSKLFPSLDQKYLKMSITYLEQLEFLKNNFSQMTHLMPRSFPLGFSEGMFISYFTHLGENLTTKAIYVIYCRGK